MKTIILHLSCGLVFFTTLTSCWQPQSTAATTELQSSQVKITYTALGVPHIEAPTYRALGYGIGYAQATDNLCTLAEQLLKLQGEKSRYFGAGNNQKNLLSDIAYKALDYPTEARQLFTTLPLDSQLLLGGYADGFNAKLTDMGQAAAYPTPCRGMKWVAPITAELLLAYHLDLAALASSRPFLSAMAIASPPGQTQMLASFPLDLDPIIAGIGSNGWALGGEKSAEAQSMLLANPHFPWDGELRFFQQHLTIPGELDVTGLTLIGMPAVLIGFNRQLGWTHTVSQAKRFTLYQLELDPTNPLRYRYGDSYRDFAQKTVEVRVLQPDQTQQTIRRTLYSSHYGPLLDLTSLTPALGWNRKSVITIRDANVGNVRLLPHWLALGKAKNSKEFLQAFSQHHGIPWVNTLMADAKGTVLYADGSQVPLLSKTAEQYWAQAIRNPLIASIWQEGAGNILLPGSDPAFEWQSHADSPIPGLVPFSLAPQLESKDYVFNANSSHWLTHLQVPLEGFSLAYGPERTERSPRTRYNAQLITGLDEHQLVGPDLKFTFAELKQVFNHQGGLFGEELRTALANRCQQQPQRQHHGRLIDLTIACQTLQQWDGRYQLDSRGAHLMREFLLRFRSSGEKNMRAEFYANPFNPEHPATTPNGLAAAPTQIPEQDPILSALADAVLTLQQHGIALNASLAEIQFVQKNELHKISMAGGYSFEGAFNMSERLLPSRSTADLANVVTGTAVANTLLSEVQTPSGKALGYRINYGSNFVMALQFNATGPVAEILHATGQSHDPASAHFIDATQLFSQQKWQPMLFQRRDIEAAALKTIILDSSVVP
jgi:acyl-homoserine-lactone acylase